MLFLVLLQRMFSPFCRTYYWKSYTRPIAIMNMAEGKLGWKQLAQGCTWNNPSRETWALLSEFHLINASDIFDNQFVQTLHLTQEVVILNYKSLLVGLGPGKQRSIRDLKPESHEQQADAQSNQQLGFIIIIAVLLVHFTTSHEINMHRIKIFPNF